MGESLRQLGERLGSSLGGLTITFEDVALVLLLSFVLGQVIAWAYVWTHRGVSYSQGFVQALVLVCMIVAVVMVVVGDSLARAFGLVGALAIIRFRTAVRDTKDIAFIFLSLAIGIGVGSRAFLPAVIGTAVICLVALHLHLTGVGSRHKFDGLLRLRLVGTEELERVVGRVLSRYCSRFSTLSIGETDEENVLEHSYRLRLRDPGLRALLVHDLRALEGVSGLDLLLQEENAEL
ncbi:MAG: DUF4956 domain-containing protein [Planctomycetota bacterium]